MPGYQFKFNYNGKDYLVDLSPFPWGGGNTTFSVTINRRYQGRVYKEDEFWHPLDTKNFADPKNTPFVLQGHDFQILGEIIEREFPENF